MPKASIRSASQVQDMGVLESRAEELGPYTVEFTTFRADADAAPLFAGLPDGRCQSPHWGYVLKGQLTFSYADGAETFQAGDAYYGAPGHIPSVLAGTEVVEFSPTEEYKRTLEVLSANIASAQAS
jgi:hypothetical protein